MRLLGTLLLLSASHTLGSVEDNLINNAALVSSLNADEADHAVYELNDFASLSFEEFKAQRLMPKQKVPEILISKRISFPVDAETLDSFDWEAEGAVTSVKDQGSVGTCWAFSTAANIEGQIFIQTQQSINVSVEMWVECDASDDPDGLNGYGCADCGVFGGWPYLAYSYAQNGGGVHTWEDWPYCVSPPRHSTLEQCWPCMPSGYSKADCGSHADFYCDANTTLGQGPTNLCGSSDGAVAQIGGWDAISTNETEIAQFLVSTGPLSVLMNAETLSFYKSGIYSPSHCDPSDLDHAVLLVGYGTDDGVDYWRVKNSWGASWGEGGYFRIQRGSGMCGINTAVTTGYIA